MLAGIVTTGQEKSDTTQLPGCIGSKFIRLEERGAEAPPFGVPQLGTANTVTWPPSAV